MIKQCAAIPSNDGGYCCEVGAGRQATWPESRCDRESRPARPFCLKEWEKMIIWQLCYCHVCFNAFYIIKTNACVSTSPAWTTNKQTKKKKEKKKRKEKEKKMLKKKKFLNLSVLASGGSQDGFFLSHRWETWRVTQPLLGSITKMKTKTVVLRGFRPTQHCAVYEDKMSWIHTMVEEWEEWKNLQLFQQHRSYSY